MSEAIAAIYTLYGLYFQNTVLGGVSNFGMSSGAQQQIFGLGDGYMPGVIVYPGLSPQIQFATADVEALLTKMVTSNEVVGVALGADTSAVKFALQKITAAGRQTGAVAIGATCTAGYAIPQTLSWMVGQTTTLSTLVQLLSSDGVTSPITGLSKVQTASSLVGTLTTPTACMLGAVTLNGTSFPAIAQCTVNFGITRPLLRSGAPYPTLSWTQSLRPQIILASLHPEAFSDWTDIIGGVAQSASDSVVNFNNMADKSTRGADASIVLTIDDGMLEVTDLGANPQTPATAAITITPTYDLTNPLIACTFP